MRFLDGIPATRKEELLKQLKAVWTHDAYTNCENKVRAGTTTGEAAAKRSLVVRPAPRSN